MKTTRRLLLIICLISFTGISYSQPEYEFKIFQFPADRIPRIDGNPDDWDIVPDSYSIVSIEYKGEKLPYTGRVDGLYAFLKKVEQAEN